MKLCYSTGSMNQRAVVALIVVLVFIGGGIALFNYLTGDAPAVQDLNPTPQPDLTQTTQINPQQFSAAPQQSPAAPAVAGASAKPRKKYNTFPGVLAPENLKNRTAVIETDKGKINFEIYPEATKAASNFIFLAQEGFYDGITFHRVEPNFVIQGGDPNGNGTGDPGYLFADEPVTRPYLRGTVAMAKRAEPNTNGSQFFIVLADNPPLDPKYTIFGRVTTGMDVVAKIQVGDVMRKVSVTTGTP